MSTLNDDALLNLIITYINKTNEDFCSLDICKYYKSLYNARVYILLEILSGFNFIMFSHVTETRIYFKKNKNLLKLNYLDLKRMIKFPFLKWFISENNNDKTSS